MSSPRYALVANVQSADVSIFAVQGMVQGALGRLTYLSSLTTGAWPVAMAVHPNGAFAYVADSAVPGGSTSDSLTVIHVAADGVMTTFGAKVRTASAPVGLAISPNGAFLYVACSSTTPALNGVEAFSINAANGALTRLPSTSSVANLGVSALAINPRGTFLCLVDHATSRMSMCSVDSATGALRLLAAPITTGAYPNAVHFSANGALVFLTNDGAASGSGALAAYSVNPASGALSLVASLTVGMPTRLHLHPSGQWLYLLNDVLALLVFSVNPGTGALSQASATPIATPPGAGVEYAANIGVDPTGAYLAITWYAQGLANTVSMFSIDARNGALTPVLGGTISSGGAWPSALAFIAGQNPVQSIPTYLYAVNGSDQTISTFSIAPASGALAPLGSPLGVADIPDMIAVEPTGRFLYCLAVDLAGQGSCTIATYQIDQGSGALTLTGPPITPQEPLVWQLVIDPLNRFLFALTEVYAPSADDQRVSVFAIDPHSGALTEIGSTTLQTGGYQTPFVRFAIDPTGSHLYTANGMTSNLYAYAIDGTTGALSLVGSLAIPSGSFTLAVDPTARFLYASYPTITSSIQAFSLPPAGGIPIAAGSTATAPPTCTPDAISIHPNGQFLYATLSSTSVSPATAGYIDGFLIDQATGTLSPLPGSPYAAGAGALFLSMDASGSFLYAVGTSSAGALLSNAILGFSIDQATGQLTPINGSPFISAPTISQLAVLNLLH